MESERGLWVQVRDAWSADQERVGADEQRGELVASVKHLQVAGLSIGDRFGNYSAMLPKIVTWPPCFLWNSRGPWLMRKSA